MITASMIHRYGIVAVHDNEFRIDELFSDSDNDPLFQAFSSCAHLCQKGNKMDCVVGIGKSWGYCSVQVIIFRSEAGYRKYLSDGAVVFDN